MAEPLTTGGGTLAARGSLTRSRRRLAANDTPAQRGAVTRANRYARAAQARERTAISGARPGSTVARPQGSQRRQRGQGSAANSIRPTGRLRRPVAQSNIRRTSGSRRGPLKVQANAVRAYRAATPEGKARQAIRRIGRAVKSIDSQRSKLQGIRREAADIMTRIARSTARNVVDSGKKGPKGEVARLMMRVESGRMQRAARDVIRRRAGRAAAVAARGRKVGTRALQVYDRQLAPALPGKKSSGKNSIKPGPRNTKGTPKRRRKRKG